MSIYSDLFSELELLPDDAEKLKRDRGFTDKTIEDANLKSAYSHNEGVILGFKDNKYTEKELIDAGFGTRREGDFEISPQLTKDNILIPFYSDKGEMVYFRAHKFGLAGIVPPLYLPPDLPRAIPTLVLAESEFKALAAQQLGINAIGLCGISMYAKNNFPILAKFIKQRNCKNVILLWDNDNKVDDHSPHYKKDPKSRYDVEYYSYVMAYQIAKICECKVALLPDEWRIDHSIDIDAALAAGHTEREFQKILLDSVTSSVYAKGWSDECKDICEPKIDKFFFSSYIDVEFGRYVKSTSKALKELSNFTLEVIYNHHISDTELIRGVAIKNKRGKTVRVVDAEAKELTSLSAFKELIVKSGNFYFSGVQADLDEIYKRMCYDGTSAITHTPFQVGKFKTGYLFNNIFIKDSGGIYTPKKEGGVIQVDDVGYRPKKFEVGEHIMGLNLNTEEFDYRDMFRRLIRNWTSYEPILGLGWIIACVFLDAIAKRYRSFPILFVGGMKEGGKTSLVELLTAIHGMHNEVCNADEISRVALSRSLKYFSNLAVWIDEYRPTEATAAKLDGYMRSVYDRQGAGKGLKESEEQIRKVPVHGGLIISGEAAPIDSSLNTRLININMDKRHIEGSEYKWLINNIDKFSYAYVDIARQRDAKLEQLFETIDLTRETLNKQWDLSDRYALNYAIILGALEVFADDVIPQPRDKFMEWCKNHTQGTQLAVNEEHVLNQFIADLSYLTLKKKMDECISISLDTATQYVIHIHLKTAFDIWTRYKKDIGQPVNRSFNSRTLAQYMKSIGWYYKTHRVGSRNASCLCIPLMKAGNAEVIENFAASDDIVYEKVQSDKRYADADGKADTEEPEVQSSDDSF